MFDAFGQMLPEQTGNLEPNINEEGGMNLRHAVDIDIAGPEPSSSTIVSSCSATLSSLTVDSIESYPEERGAGIPVAMRDQQLESDTDTSIESMSGSLPDKQEPWYPFPSEGDYALALWMHESQLSSGAIDRFFQDKRLRRFHSDCSFNNAQTLKDKMQNRHGTGINTDWFRQDFRIDGGRRGSLSKLYQVLYFDILSIIKSLLGHRPFAPSLNYRPIRQRNLNGARVFSEMHTADWWWEMQDKLPDGSTVVPIILASDKTHLSRMHGDQQAWPVYITIGNLLRDVRRAQSRPGMMLLGMVPIIQETEYKAEVYHHALGIMTKGENASIPKGLPLLTRPT